MLKKHWQGALIGILLVELVGVLSSLAAGPIQERYLALYKPSLSPPPWLFGVVWPLLYALMGVALYLVYHQYARGMGGRQALWLFGAQLAVNFIWPVVFFRWGRLWGGALVLAVLIALAVATAAAFGRVSRTAALLLGPYLAWILFAFYLNVGIALLNP